MLHGSQRHVGRSHGAAFARGALIRDPGGAPGPGGRESSGKATLGRKSELVRLAGIEPTTLGFGGQYSIH